MFRNVRSSLFNLSKHVKFFVSGAFDFFQKNAETLLTNADFSTSYYLKGFCLDNPSGILIYFPFDVLPSAHDFYDDIRGYGENTVTLQ